MPTASIDGDGIEIEADDILVVSQDGHDFELFAVAGSLGISLACIVEGTSSGLPLFTSTEARVLAKIFERAADELDSR
jgi:hypothetical protein